MLRLKIRDISIIIIDLSLYVYNLLFFAVIASLHVFRWQILDVNNQNFEKISHNRALDVLRGSTHLSITVKSNAVGKVIDSV